MSSDQAEVRIVTVDGPSGSGKGTVCQMIAERLGWPLLDTGAIYRVLALAAERKGIELDNVEKVAELAVNLPLSFENSKVMLDGEDVSDLIRTEKAGNAASKVAVIPEVRAALLDWQRNYAKPPGLVADGRDTGSVVFPRAQAKIFLTASAEERAKRRYKQLIEKGLDVNVASLAAEIRERDERDSNRSVAPLKAPAAALEVDSTGRSIEEVFETVLEKVRQTFPELEL